MPTIQFAADASYIVGTYPATQRAVYVDPTLSTVAGVRYQAIEDAAAYVLAQDDLLAVVLSAGTHQLGGSVQLAGREFLLVAPGSSACTVVMNGYGMAVQDGALKCRGVTLNPNSGVSPAISDSLSVGAGSVDCDDVLITPTGSFLTWNPIRLSAKSIRMRNCGGNLRSGMAAWDLWTDELMLDGVVLTGDDGSHELLSVSAGAIGNQTQYDHYRWSIRNSSFTTAAGANGSGSIPLVYLQSSNVSGHYADKHCSVVDTVIRALNSTSDTPALYVQGPVDKSLNITIVDSIVHADSAVSTYDIAQGPGNVSLTLANTTRADLSAVRVAP